MKHDYKQLLLDSTIILDTLTTATKSEDTLEKVDALEILALYYDESIQNIIINLLDDSDELVQISVLEIIIKLQNNKFLPLIRKKLYSDNFLVRSYAIEAVGIYHDEESKNLLIEMLRTADDEEKSRIYYALIELGEVTYYKNLFLCLNHSHYRVRIATINLLFQLANQKNESIILKNLNKRISVETEISVIDSLENVIKDIQSPLKCQ